MGQAKRRGSFEERLAQAVDRIALEEKWMDPLPGTELVTSGDVEAGDLFYFAPLGVWMSVPKIAIGQPIGDRRVARGLIDMSRVDTSRLGKHN